MVAVMLISTVGIVGNIITLIILKKNKNYLIINNSRLHIGHLAFLDLCFSVTNAFSGLGFIDREIMTGTFLCDFYARLTTVQVPSTCLTHANIALHRLQSLQAFGSNNQQRLGFLHRWHSIAAIWISSIIISCFLNINKVFAPISFSSSYGTCDGTGTIFGVILTCVFTLSDIVVLVSYIQIYRLVKINNRQIRDQIKGTDATERMFKRREAKITKMLFIISGSLLVTNVSFVVIANLNNVYRINLIWNKISYLLLLTNYANNFFIYGLMDKKFRAQIKSLCQQQL